MEASQKPKLFSRLELAGGDDGTRTRDLMRDRYVKDIAGVDSTGPWLAADGPYCPSFSLVCGPVVAQLENRIAAHCRRAAPDVACVCAILFDAPCHASRRPNVCIRAHGAGLETPAERSET